MDRTLKWKKRTGNTFPDRCSILLDFVRRRDGSSPKRDDLKPLAHPYAVLSYDYWASRFGRDPKVIGRTFHIGNDIYQIIGVGPERFTGIEPGTVVDIFSPQ